MSERLLVNPLAAPGEPEPPPDGPHAFHRSLPGYTPRPLVEAPAAAEALGVRRVLVKDESSRLGLPSFKVLGASWATYRAACRHIGAELGVPLGELRRRLDGRVSLACTTEGNHGRAVARMAALLGLPATVLVPAGTDAARRRAPRAGGGRGAGRKGRPPPGLTPPRPAAPTGPPAGGWGEPLSPGGAPR